jgi:zinc transport system permease protein
MRRSWAWRWRWAFSISVFIGTLATALAMAVLVSTLAGRGWAMDTTLGVLAHSALALGLVAVSFLPRVRVNLTAYLFGDILTVGVVGSVGHRRGRGGGGWR